jgi:orotidine-5'-phosphate decarboxylase
MPKSESRIIIALDYPSERDALAFVDKIKSEQCRLKIGKELFTRCGPSLVEKLVSRGYDVFLDLKYHDIPNTVARACQVAAELGVWMLNVHTLGGRNMMTAARDALQNCSHQPLLIGVTILTSMNSQDLAEVGLQADPAENVNRLARLAKDSGLDGVVCSAMESANLRNNLGADFKLVTPGIRPAGSKTHDQSRILTPADAIKQGSDYLVIGRPITESSDPLETLLTIESEISDI